jgi:hypothetical protein
VNAGAGGSVSLTMKRFYLYGMPMLRVVVIPTDNILGLYLLLVGGKPC